jgi:hypothetical protein
MYSEYRRVSPPRLVQVREQGKWKPALLEGWRLSDRTNRALIRYDGVAGRTAAVWVDATKVRKPQASNRPAPHPQTRLVAPESAAQ